MNIIEVNSLYKHYGSVEALRGLTLEMEEGIFGFIGPNGSGKTTTIKLLLGTLRRDGGEARVLGFDCFKESFEVRRRVGVLHEKADYPKDISGLEYLTFVGTLYGLEREKVRSKANNLLDLLNISEAADRSIGGYSAGMRQRLGLAQALIGDPKLVFLDEPTSNLDPLGRAELLETIKALHQDQGVSFFIASHVLPELQKVCDQVGVISKGVMLEQGSIAEITKRYLGNAFKVGVSDPQALAEELRKVLFVEEVSVRDNTVWVKVSEPDRLYEEVSRIVQEKKMQLLLFQRASLDLEEFFKSLLKEERK